MDDKNTEYADKYVVNILEEDIKFQGHMHNAKAAHMNPPLLMLMKRGNNAVQSVPNDNELARMLVPNWAKAKAALMRKTPALFPDV